MLHQSDQKNVQTPTASVSRVPQDIALQASGVQVTLLTGGGDRPYVHGIGTALKATGIGLDLIGSDDVFFPEFRNENGFRFLNLRGSQDSKAGIVEKISRVLAYYARLIRYAATAQPGIFHILWNNKFEYFDRTLLMLYYKLLGKRIAYTVHNVNAGRRDGTDSPLNRATLRAQYRLCDRIFVHTKRMKEELVSEFGVDESRVVIIPFGVNNSVPNTTLTRAEARLRLGIAEREKVILFFGNINPYKGVEYLAKAFQELRAKDSNYRLVIAGKPDRFPEYWEALRATIDEDVRAGKIILKAEFVPDEETEIYFKAADVLVLPYKHIYQSGVLFLAYSFGLPVVAADVGSLPDEIVEGQTGFVFRSEDSEDLVRSLNRYFSSDLYARLSERRQDIQRHVAERNSWNKVAKITISIYLDMKH